MKDSVPHVSRALTHPLLVMSSSVTVQTDSSGMALYVRTVITNAQNVPQRLSAAHVKIYQTWRSEQLIRSDRVNVKSTLYGTMPLSLVYSMVPVQ